MRSSPSLPATPLILAAIAAELERVGARPGQPLDPASVGVNDEGDGWASLGASEARHDFYWYGRGLEILDRLERIADAAGPEAVRAAFHTALPPELARYAETYGS